MEYEIENSIIKKIIEDSEDYKCNLAYKGDGVCHEACNTKEHKWDDGDCQVLTEGPKIYIGNDFCDKICNNEKNLFDKGYCDICEEYMKGDGFCDIVCNNSKNNFDEGDCLDKCKDEMLGDDYWGL